MYISGSNCNWMIILLGTYSHISRKTSFFLIKQILDTTQIILLNRLIYSFQNESSILSWIAITTGTPRVHGSFSLLWLNSLFVLYPSSHRAEFSTRSFYCRGSSTNRDSWTAVTKNAWFGRHSSILGRQAMNSILISRYCVEIRPPGSRL